MDKQRTIAKEVEIEGIGIHTGKSVKLLVLPANANTGINFIRVDLPQRPVIKAEVSNLVDSAGSPRRTSIGAGGANIHTVEHFMAALCALGIDNLIVHIDSEELPAMDGSAKVFLELLKSAGIKEFEASKKVIVIKEPVYINEDEASLVALPCDDFKISYTLNYNHPMLKAQYVSFTFTFEYFESNIAPARTFCLEAESAQLVRQGFGKGANYDNTLVVGDGGVINNKLRFEDEFARHKVLDLIGDLYLLGAGIKGHIIGARSGHAVNIRLARKLSSVLQKIPVGGISSSFNGINVQVPLDIQVIQKILPHRYPFLLVDRIIEFEDNKRAVGIKNVTANEEFFQGHFPGRPVMPGVLIVEAMAQVAGVLMLAKKENQGKIAYFMGIDNVRFRRVVVPGDQLVMEVNVLRLKTRTGQIQAQASVDGKVAAEATLMFSLAD